MYNNRIIWAALASGSERIIQGVTGGKEEVSGNIFRFGFTKRR